MMQPGERESPYNNYNERLVIGRCEASERYSADAISPSPIMGLIKEALAGSLYQGELMWAFFEIAKRLLWWDTGARQIKSTIT